MPLPRPSARAAALVLALWPVAGCTSVVWPPTAVAQPTTAFVLREALHIGIVLPVPAVAPTRYVEYGFGDWRWFALGDDAWYRVFPTVLWPTAATLCRRVYDTGDPTRLAALARARGSAVDPLVIEADRAAALAARLDAAFATAPIHRRPELDMEFVPTDGSYWLFTTCADVAADWCRELGCRVSPALVRGSLAVAVPVPPAHDG